MADDVLSGAATGAVSGASTGASVGGGWGALIGGVLGAVAGGVGASGNQPAPIDCGFGMVYDPVSNSCVPITSAEREAGQETTTGQKAMRSLAMGMAEDDFGRQQVYNRLYKPKVDAGSGDS